MTELLADKTILIVNDDPDMRLFLRRIIEDAGGRVVTADGDEAGMEIVRTRPPDVVVLDVMIRPDGRLSLFDELKRDSSLSGMPVVFVSSMDETTVYRLSAASLGARPDGILEKPPDADDLICTLTECVSRVTDNGGKTE